MPSVKSLECRPCRVYKPLWRRRAQGKQHLYYQALETVNSVIPTSMHSTVLPAARGFISYTSIFGVTDAGSPHNGSTHKRRLEQLNEETTGDAEGIPATVPSSIMRPSLYSMAQTNGTTPVKRGPGRPRKAPVDANSDSAAPGPSTASGQDGESPAKRPRGRPKGSKNKPKPPPPSEPTTDA
jgi:hypothetical protein